MCSTLAIVNCHACEQNKNKIQMKCMYKPVTTSLKLSYAELSDSLCDVGSSNSANFTCAGPRCAAFFRCRCRCFVRADIEPMVSVDLHVVDG